MEYLLDTCALLWLGMGGGDLSAEAKRRITTAKLLYYSPISAWEIARLQKEGKIGLPNTPEGFMADLCAQYDIDELPLTGQTMIGAARLPDHHKDPADRMIIAAALEHGLTVITGDEKFARDGVPTVG